MHPPNSQLTLSLEALSLNKSHTFTPHGNILHYPVIATVNFLKFLGVQISSFFHKTKPEKKICATKSKTSKKRMKNVTAKY